MPVTDSIADMLTIIRNGSRARKPSVDVKNSKMHQRILTIFKKEGFVKNFKIIEDKKQGIIRVYLTYASNKKPAITSIKRLSRPGLRRYVSGSKIPRILNGYGVAVLSTSHGVMDDREARSRKVGGEVLCAIW